MFPEAQRRHWHVPSATRRLHTAPRSAAITMCGVRQAPAYRPAHRRRHPTRSRRRLRRRLRRMQASALHQLRLSRTDCKLCHINPVTQKRHWHVPSATRRLCTVPPLRAPATCGAKQEPAQWQGHRLATRSLLRLRLRPLHKQASALHQLRLSRTARTM